jgi:hypothetical protein
MWEPWQAPDIHAWQGALHLGFLSLHTGGWHDFFNVPDVLVPWSPAREAAEGETCARHTFDSVDELLNGFGMGWDMFDAAGAKNVRPLRPACAPAFHMLPMWGLCLGLCLGELVESAGQACIGDRRLKPSVTEFLCMPCMRQAS